MTTRDDNPGNAPAAKSELAGDAYKSAVDLSDLETEQPSKEDGESDEDDDETKTGTEDGEEAEASDEDEADDADGEEEDGDDAEDEDDDEDKPRKRSRAQRYRDQNARLQEENARLRGRVSGSLTDAQIEAKVKEVIGEPPQEKDFPDYLAWERAATAYELDKRQETRNVKNEAGRAQEAIQVRNAERADRHKERVENFRNRSGKESAKDFDTVMASAKELKASPTVEDLVLDSKKSGHLVYFFAKNPDRLNALNRMSEREAAREIGRIEARLSLPKPKTKSSAPPPPRSKPQGGAAPASQEAELNSYLKRQYGG